MKPMDRAIYWVEYVLRHNGSSHLKSNSIALNNTQYFSIDICFVIISTITIMIFIVVNMIKFIINTKNINPTKQIDENINTK